MFNHNILIIYIYFTFLIDIVRDIYYEDKCRFYQVQHKETEEFFILRSYKIIPIADEFADFNSVDSASNRSKEIEEKMQKLEEFVARLKTAMAKSESIAKYIVHWYDDDNKYCYVVSEYCTAGNLAQEIEKRINEKRKFTQKVCRCC
jgi:serine/threonine protein kinase